MSFLYNTLPGPFEERLETDLLLLRPYQEGDESDFMSLILENPFALYPAFDGRIARVRVLDDARTQMQQLRTAWDNRRTFDFGVWQKESNIYIGNIAIKNLDRKIPKAEIGLYFTSLLDTKEHVQAALQLVLQFAFEELEMNKVYMRCTEANAFYGNLVEECGFIKEGVFRSDYRGSDSDELMDLSYFGMTRTDYREMSIQQNESQVIGASIS